MYLVSNNILDLKGFAVFLSHYSYSAKYGKQKSLLEPKTYLKNYWYSCRDGGKHCVYYFVHKTGLSMLFSSLFHKVMHPVISKPFYYRERKCFTLLSQLRKTSANMRSGFHLHDRVRCSLVIW